MLTHPNSGFLLHDKISVLYSVDWGRELTYK